jgi:MFS family permease
LGDDTVVATGLHTAWSPFRYASFAVLWSATVISNIGTWMSNAASGWLMASLDSDPLIVALVQVATSLPMFLFAVPAGALADVFDRRRVLLAVQIALAAVAVVFAFLVWRNAISPTGLLIFNFLGGAGAALIAPAWQSTVPQLVPRTDLQPAIVLNGIGVNVSRAIGPALGGVMTALAGIAMPFCINAVSNLGVIAALTWWRPSQTSKGNLPAERFGSAMRLGLRHARHNPQLRATLIRAFSFFLFASAYWALLPLLARDQVRAGPGLYGILLGAIGTGAIIGALALPWVKAKTGANALAGLGTIGTVVALILFGLAAAPGVALTASVIAGLSWIAVISALNVSAQLALPEWVRGRGLSLFVTVMFGALSLGSIIWGKCAGIVGLPTAHFVAAAGALLAMAASWRWKLQGDAAMDLTPSLHWPAPISTSAVEPDRGPVLVTIEYRIIPQDRSAFLAAIETLAQERRRDGAYAWGVFEDAAEEGRMLETFLVQSWIEHLRQHERVTNADRVLQDAVSRFHVEGSPKITHLIACRE